MSIVKKLAAGALAALAVYKARDLADDSKTKPAKRTVKKAVAKTKTKAKAAVRKARKTAKQA